MSSLTKFFSDASKMFDTAVKDIKDIDINNFNSQLAKWSETAQNKVSKLIDQFKTMREKHTIEIPYDNKTSKFSFKVDNNVLDINVTSNDGLMQNGTRITIPDNVDITNVHQHYDANRHMMVFKFGMKPETKEEVNN